MPSWKKLILSGSAASLSSLSVSGDITLPYGEINDTATDLNIVGSNAVTIQTSAGTGLTFANASTTATFGSHISVPALSRVYLDGGSDSYIYQSAGDIVNIYTGGENTLELSAGGADPRISYFNKDNRDRDFSFCGDTNDNVLYFDASTERVGIGLNSPGSALHVTGSVTSNGTAAIGEFGNSGTGAIANSGHQFIIGGPSVSGYTGMIIYSDTTTGYGQISFADGRGANDSWRGTISYKHSDEYMSFWTNAAEKVRIESDGDLHGIADIIAYSSTPSDERLKDNVVTIGNSLDLVSQLRGVRFDWNIGSKKGKHDIGVIAQEVEQVIPEIVSEKKLPLLTGNDETIYKVVDYEKLTAVLIESIKELKQEIDDIKQKCDCLNK